MIVLTSVECLDFQTRLLQSVFVGFVAAGVYRLLDEFVFQRGGGGSGTRKTKRKHGDDVRWGDEYLD